MSFCGYFTSVCIILLAFSLTSFSLVVALSLNPFLIFQGDFKVILYAFLLSSHLSFLVTFVFSCLCVCGLFCILCSHCICFVNISVHFK